VKQIEVVLLRQELRRHCEEQGDEAIQNSSPKAGLLRCARNDEARVTPGSELTFNGAVGLAPRRTRGHFLSAACIVRAGTHSFITQALFSRRQTPLVSI